MTCPALYHVHTAQFVKCSYLTIYSQRLSPSPLVLVLQLPSTERVLMATTTVPKKITLCCVVNGFRLWGEPLNPNPNPNPPRWSVAVPQTLRAEGTSMGARRGQENTPALGPVIHHLGLGACRAFDRAGHLSRESPNRPFLSPSALASLDTGRWGWLPLFCIISQ